MSFVDTTALAAKLQRPRSPARVLAEAEEQWLFTEDELLHTPSIQDGMAPEKERELRAKGVNFIRQVGIMLKLPELTLSTAAIFFNRFLMRVSLVSSKASKAIHHYTLGATALFLATKVEECCRKMKELIVACCRVAQKNPNLLVDDQSKDFWKWRDTILSNEDVLLETLCFDLTIEPPHKQLFQMLKSYRVEHNKPLRNAAWSFVTDSNITQLCLLCSSRTIAAAALYAAARMCDVRLPDDKNGLPWWDAQRVSIKELVRAANYMSKNYESAPTGDGNTSAGGSGEGGQSIYVGLFADFDVELSKSDGDAPCWETTRLKLEQQGISTPPQQSGLDLDRTRQTSVESHSGGHKRSRQGTTNGTERSEGQISESDGAQSVKKRRTDAHANGSAVSANEAQASPQDVSEEGELEE